MTMANTTSSGSGSPAAQPQTSGNRLARHSVGLSGAIAQSAALVGPAVGVVVGNTFIAGLTGPASPLAFLIGTIIVVVIAKVIADYARELPSAGSFYTYLTQSFGPKTGFVTGVLLFGAYLLLLPFQLSFFGFFVSGLLTANFGVNVPWQVFAVVLIVLTAALTAAGARYSLRIGLIGLAFEIVVFTAFAVLIIVQGGAEGNTIQPFNPAQSTQGFSSGLLIACVFTIFAFVGFESATTLGEEVSEPRRTIPRAVMVSAVLLGVFFVFVTYAEVIGFGITPAGIQQLANDPTAFNTLANRYGNGVLSGLIDVAVVTSFIALNIVTVSAVTRMLYAMGRDRMLPSALSRLNRRQAPGMAAATVAVVGLAASLIFGSIYGPDTYASWSAYLATLFFIGAYILLCVGVMRFHRRRHPDNLSLVRHALIPLIGLAGIGLVLYGNVYPLPAAPLSYFIPATLVVIFAAVAVAHYLGRVDPERVRRAGQLLAAVEEDAAVQTASTEASDLGAQVPPVGTAQSPTERGRA